MSHVPFSDDVATVPTRLRHGGGPETEWAFTPLLTASRGTGLRSRLEAWVRNHDESWIFVGIYLGLAVGLSVFVSLFWLVVCGIFHLALELLRQAYYRDTISSTFLHALWEIKMDVGLILLALTLVLYLEVVLGLLGLQSAARAATASRAAHAASRAGSRAAHAGARAGSSASAIEQWVRGFLLAVDEMARVAYATLVVRKKRTENEGDAAGGAAESAELATSEVPAAEEGTHLTAEARPVGQVEPLAEEDGSGAADATDDSGDVAPAETPAEDLAPAQAPEPTPPSSARHRPPEETTEEPAEADREPDPAAPAPETDEAQDASWEPYLTPLPHPAWRASWGAGDHIGLLMVAVGILLLLAAPYVTLHGWDTAVAALLAELRPF